MDTVRLPGGAAVALATPLDERGELDHAGLERLVRRVLSGGVSMVCPTGSTGEGARLGPRRRAEVAAAVRGLVPAEVPVVAGLPATDTESVLTELAGLAATGVTAALVSPPSYFPMPGDEVLRFYEELAAATPLPIVLYNIPQFTKVTIPPPVVGDLAAHPAIAGIKDSGRDMEYLLAVLEATSGGTGSPGSTGSPVSPTNPAADFTVLTGTDTLLMAGLLSGADGTIAASANLVPELGAEICRSVASGDLDRALRAQRRLTDVVLACRRGTPPAGWKSALEIAGICDRRLAGRAAPLSGQDHAALADHLARLGVVKERR
ncbi:MAG TPA: dihydrodipicolinate synthase family protein [Streptosporangiaceae bacterium]|nr:dihydrodipicolinate synthase family protein [Streptosporangiaceae bacterium]